MNADNFVLPEYWKIADIPDEIELDPLQLFIFNNEPAGSQEKSFRKELEDAIKFVLRKAQ